MSRPSEKLFADAQSDLFEKSYEENVLEEKSQPVECLGKTFHNDEDRRKYLLGKLREKLKDPEFRKIEGLPIGLDENILALSNPPYFTAYPDPSNGGRARHFRSPAYRSPSGLLCAEACTFFLVPDPP